MPNQSEKLAHPGTFIKENVIPPGMSVTEAAKRLGVGRPALSNLLNGNSSLSPNMAVRLEKSFGADRQKLFDLQSAFDSHNRHGEEKGVAAHAYVPAFLTIKARQIQDWAENTIEARHLLPVLLRKLVHSTGHELRKVDVPGYDNAERHGCDGVVEAARPRRGFRKVTPAGSSAPIRDQTAKLRVIIRTALNPSLRPREPNVPLSLSHRATGLARLNGLGTSRQQATGKR